MAGRFGRGTVSGVSTGTAKKTVMQLIAAANHAIKLVEVGFSFTGTSNTGTPILVELLRQTDAGTMSALTLVKADDSVGDSLDTTGQHTATAEPTGGDVLWEHYVHPQTGGIYQLHDLAGLIVGAGDRVGLAVTADADVNFAGHLAFEE